jgi:hypothetical protein
MMKVAILDDYQDVALKIADWCAVDASRTHKGETKPC